MPASNLFQKLPEGSKIPASPRRVVALQRSTRAVITTALSNVQEPTHAYLVTVHTLRGQHAFYLFFAFDAIPGGHLFARSPVSAPISQSLAFEREACDWLHQHGYDMVGIQLGTLDDNVRSDYLSELPLSLKAHPGPNDSPTGESNLEDTLNNALSSSLNGEIRDTLRRLLVMS